MMQLTELQKKIGSEIKKLRCMNEMTQEQVAEKLHIDRNAYGEIERGRTDIHLSRLVQIANFFGVPADNLLASRQRMTLYMTGTSNTQSHNQCNEYYNYSLENLYELEKAQLKISFLEKELQDKQKIIALLENKIAGN